MPGGALPVGVPVAMPQPGVVVESGPVAYGEDPDEEEEEEEDQPCVSAMEMLGGTGQSSRQPLYHYGNIAIHNY